MRLDPKAGKVVERGYIEKGSGDEFPTVPDPHIGKPWRYSLYAGISSERSREGEVWNKLKRVDYETQRTEVFEFGENRSTSEPILVHS